LIHHDLEHFGASDLALSDLATLKKAKGSAAGQYLGYALQPVRLFFHLLTCPSDSYVGLEYADDISVHAGDKVLLAEQCKSALTGNPTSNWSVDFWKTIANWIENSKSGFISPESTSLQLYVVPQKKHGFSGRLSDLKTDNEIDAAIVDIVKKRGKLSSAPECEPYLLKVLGADPVLRRLLIRNFVLVNSDSDPISPILAHLDALVRKEMQEAAVRYGIGDALKLIDEAMRSGAPPVISASAFRKRFRAFISAHDSERFLHSLADAPTDEVIESTISESPCFIRQLDLVDANIDEKTRAASDFLRTTGDRTRWAEEGLVFEGSMNEFDSALLRRHQNLKTEVGLVNKSLSEKEQGRLLYSRCCQSSSIALEARVVPEHFMSGSLNALSDRREIGWHPDFDKLLDSEAT
jgi:hypothetical protein